MKGFGFEVPFGENDQHSDRKCYGFNELLDPSLDDDDCTHCHKYLTVQCDNIDEFINNDEV